MEENKLKLIKPITNKKTKQKTDRHKQKPTKNKLEMVNFLI